MLDNNFHTRLMQNIVKLLFHSFAIFGLRHSFEPILCTYPEHSCWRGVPRVSCSVVQATRRTCQFQHCRLSLRNLIIYLNVDNLWKYAHNNSYLCQLQMFPRELLNKSKQLQRMCWLPVIPYNFIPLLNRRFYFQSNFRQHARRFVATVIIRFWKVVAETCNRNLTNVCLNVYECIFTFYNCVERALSGVFDPHKYTNADMCRIHAITYECLMEDEESQVRGFVHFADGAGVSFPHLTLFTPKEAVRIVKNGEVRVL